MGKEFRRLPLEAFMHNTRSSNRFAGFYVYCLTLDGSIVYIGCSKVLCSRFWQHIERMQKDPIWEWNGIGVIQFATWDEAKVEEKRLIQLLDPPLNTTYASKGSEADQILELLGLK